MIKIHIMIDKYGHNDENKVIMTTELTNHLLFTIQHDLI